MSVGSAQLTHTITTGWGLDLTNRVKDVHTAPRPDATPEPVKACIQWARHLDEVREAQRLRYQVFANEWGAHIASALPGHDIDVFDDYCEHLTVRAGPDGPVVGTYRVLVPAQASRMGGTYTDTEFDLVRLRGLRPGMVEFGRSCVHPDHRQGSVIMALWGALIAFMQQNHFETMLGCASIPMLHNGVVNTQVAASLWARMKETHLAPIEYRVSPRFALPLHQAQADLAVEPPPLIRGYLRLGAKLLGPPAWDQDFNSADLPMMLALKDIPEKYRRHFLRA
ncbi:MAG: GNAT family N-acetyltransferase [Betaproteobacteria bacterium]|jgi:putative hemolysin|nr:GNAT family N-acetyltransferase [Betaproteobacteria bacterium]